MAKGNIASMGVEPFLAAAIVLAVDDMRVMIMAVHWSDGSCSNALLCRAHNLARATWGLGYKDRLAVARVEVRQSIRCDVIKQDNLKINRLTSSISQNTATIVTVRTRAAWI